MKGLIMNNKIGDKDEQGSTIEGVWANGQNFVIYEIEGGYIKTSTNDPELSKAFTKLDPKYLKLRALTFNNKSLKNSFRISHIRALIMVASGNIEGANALLDEEEKRLLKFGMLARRLNYLLSCMIALLVAVSVTIILAMVPNVRDDYIFYSLIVTCGSLGAFLSVITNLNKLEIDRYASIFTNIVAGVSRIIIGIIGAIFAFLLIRADIMLGIVDKLNSEYAILAISVVAGFSETLVPNIMKKIEEKQSGNA
jgi:hypothetical protein